MKNYKSFITLLFITMLSGCVVPIITKEVVHEIVTEVQEGKKREKLKQINKMDWCHCQGNLSD
jgi:hypothetical protein